MTSVTVTIMDRDYTLLTDGEPAVTQKVAEKVDAAIRETTAGGRLSLADGAILACMNLTEDYLKEVESNDNLRRQMKEYLEEATKLKLELSEAKREIFRLQGKK